MSHSYLDLDPLRLLYRLLLCGGGEGCLLGDGDLEGDLEDDLDRDLDLDLDLLSSLLRSCSFIFLAFCLALKNSYKPSFSHPSLKIEREITSVFKQTLLNKTS